MQHVYSSLRDVPRDDEQRPIGWTCFICCHCFPLSAPYTEQDLGDGLIRNVCIKCSEAYLKLCQTMNQKMCQAAEEALKKASEHS